MPSITLLLRLEFCRRDLDMNFHCCQGFTTSGPLILVRLSCYIASSTSYISNVHPPSAPSTVKIPLSLEFPTAQQFGELFHISAHKSVFLDKNQSEKWTENG